MRRICSREFFIVSTVIGFLVWLMIPHCGRGHLVRARVTSCAHNMMQLYKLAATQGEAPLADGWVSLTRSKPPLIEDTMREVLACPVRDAELGPQECHY